MPRGDSDRFFRPVAEGANQRVKRPMESSAVRNVSDPRPKRLRSQVTNGRRTFVEGGDERSPWARRFRDLILAHAGDLGGIDVLSEAQRSLVRRAVTIEIQLEQLEGQLSEGKAADLAVYATASGHLRRLLETLGIERRAREVTLTLGQVLRNGADNG